MANDPNSLAAQLAGTLGRDLPQDAIGAAGYAFSPSMFTPASNGGYVLTSALGQQQQAAPTMLNQGGDTYSPLTSTATNYAPPGSIAKPIPTNYNMTTGLFDSGAAGNTNTAANVAPGALGGGTQTATTLDDNLTKALKQLMQMSQDQSTAGQNLLKGLLDQLQGNINFNQSQTTRTSGQRDALVSALLGGNFDDNGAFTANGQGLLGGYNQLLGKIDQGLDPMTMAALNQQAIEGPQNDYQNQVQQLKEALGQRGAYGGGDTPGSFGDIVRGYAPLTTARDTTREGLLQQTAFQNQAQKNTNNELVQQALSQLGGLTTNLASNYNPASYNSATQNALQNALSGVGQNTATGFQGLNTAGNLASILNDTSTGSLGSLLKAALIGSGTQAVTNGIANAAKNSGGFLAGLAGLLGGHPGSGPDQVSGVRDYLAQYGIDTKGLDDKEVMAILQGIDLTQYGAPPQKGPI